MKKKNNYYREKLVEELTELGLDDYYEVFEEGFSDSEISKEFGVDEVYVRNLREEYQRDY